MITYRSLIVLFVLINVAFAGRHRSRKFDQLHHEDSIKTTDSAGSSVRYVDASTIGHFDGSSVDRSSNLTVFIYNLGVGFHTMPYPPFCCWDWSSNRCTGSKPTNAMIHIYTDRTQAEYRLGRYDVGRSQQGPLIDTDILVFWDSYGGAPSMRIVSALPGTTNVAVSWFQPDQCGGSYTYWRNFSLTWERPSQNVQPSVWYYGPYINQETGLSDWLTTDFDVHWQGVYDEIIPYNEPQYWQVGAMNFMVGGSHRTFWILKDGVEVPVLLRYYDRNLFHPYHETSPEVVFPNNGQRYYPTWPFSGTYDVSTEMTLHRCYQDTDNEIYPVVRYEEHYNWQTYLQGNIVRAADGVPPWNVPDGSFAPLSAAFWNYTSRVDWDSVSSSWELAPGPNVVYTAYNDTTPLPTWRNTTADWQNLVGIKYHPDKFPEKCYCALGSYKCNTDSKSPAASKEIENPWIKPDHNTKPKPHYKPAVRV